MFESLQNNAISDINVVYKLIDIHNNSLDQYDPNERFRIKQYYLSSSVTRLYAINEKFIESIVADYLDALSEFVPFLTLPEGLKTEYRIGISHILSKIEQGRYNHLNHENVVEWYYQAIKGSANYKFVTDALTRHQENFRLNIIEILFGKIQLRDFKDWICKHHTMKTLYNNQENIQELLDSEIRDFVQLRNDASHGNLDNIEGHDKLKRLCDVNISLINSISSFVRKSLLDQKVDLAKIQPIGTITELFVIPQAHIIQFKEQVQLSKGMQVIVLNQRDCYINEILSIQDNGIELDEFIIPNDGYELGIKFRTSSHIGSRLFFKN